MTAYATGSMLPPIETCGRTALGHVLALHCSGADGRQWRKLGPALGPDFALRAPDLSGACYRPVARLAPPRRLRPR